MTRERSTAWLTPDRATRKGSAASAARNERHPGSTGCLAWLASRLLLLPLVLPVGAAAQAPVAPAATVEDALHAMSARAGVIFVGTVASIRRVAGTGGASGAVEVTFAVEQAVRGAVAGETYTFREWAGLWMSDDQRYRVGQRRLMLLHQPTAAGLSSPVDGPDGAIPVYGTAPRIGPDSTSIAAASATADLRWVAASHTVRSAAAVVSSTPLSGAHGTPLQSVSSRAQRSSSAGVTTNAASAVPGTAQAPVTTLLALLKGWEVSDAR